MITDMQRTVQAREIAEELRMQVTSGRAQHYWDLPVERALHQMLGDLVSLRLWAQIDWYGPLGNGVPPSTRSRTSCLTARPPTRSL